MFILTRTILLSGVTLLTLLPAVAENLSPIEAKKNHLQRSQISLNATQTASQIYEVLKPSILDFDIDSCSVGLECRRFEISEKNAQSLILKIAAVVQDNQSLEFNLLAFPFKSGNKDRNVIGALADMAEYKSLEYLNSLISKIKKIYPNSSLVIYTDGLLFNDLFEISDQTVLDYEESLQKLSTDFPEIKIITFSTLVNKRGLKIQEIRDEIDSKAFHRKPSPDKLTLMKKRILNEINHSNHSYSRLSPQEQERLLDRVSILVSNRAKMASDFIKQFQNKNSFHLSQHYQKDLSHKIGLKLSNSFFVTPANGVLFQEKDGTPSIKFKHQIDMSHYQQVMTTINGVSCPSYKWR